MYQRILQWKVVGSYIAMIVLVYLSNTGIFGWRTIEQASNIPGEILVPAWFTFAIWWVIYLGMAAFTIYQWRKSTLQDSAIATIRPWIIANFLANWLRLPAATMTNWSWITVVLIIFMWYSLYVINTTLKDYAHAKATRRYIVMPMSIYFWWITVATSLNIASVVSWLWFPIVVQSIPWVLGWIALAGSVSILIFQKFRYLSYISVFLWALIGVIVERQTDAPIISWIATILFFGVALYVLYRGIHKKVILQ